MIKIDNKQQIYAGSFLVKDDQEAEVSVPIENEFLRLSIVFRKAESGEERSAEWKTESGVVKFSFTGWNNSLGTCVLEPMKFADFGNRKIYFQLAHHFVGLVNLAHLFIYLGGENE